jgi:hypothetical protein
MLVGPKPHTTKAERNAWKYVQLLLAGLQGQARLCLKKCGVVNHGSYGIPHNANVFWEDMSAIQDVTKTVRALGPDIHFFTDDAQAIFWVVRKDPKEWKDLPSNRKLLALLRILDTSYKSWKAYCDDEELDKPNFLHDAVEAGLLTGKVRHQFCRNIARLFDGGSLLPGLDLVRRKNT